MQKVLVVALAAVLITGIAGATRADRADALPIPRLKIAYNDSQRGVDFSFRIRPSLHGDCQVTIALVYGRDGRRIRQTVFWHNWCRRGTSLRRILFAPPPQPGGGYRACVSAVQGLEGGRLSVHRRCQSFTVR